jgi:hypothetical protein
MVQPDLDATGRRAIDENPFFVGAVRRQRTVADCALVAVVARMKVCGWGEGVVRRRRTIVRRYDGLANDVGFTNPGTLGVGKHNGDNVTVGLEGVDQREDVGGGLGAWWAIVVDNEDMHFG